MYLKSVDGPRVVNLSDGSAMTRADLPDPRTTRWVASRKAAIVRGVMSGLVTEEEVCDMYGLTEEELDSWRVAVLEHGTEGLKTTALRRHRQIHA